MTKENLFSALWDAYTAMTPSAKQIHAIFERPAGPVINDHIAFRTFNDPRVGIDVLAAPFLQLGYIEKGDYEFTEKKLFAHHYELPEDPSAPKIFISELLLEEFSEDTQRIIGRALDQIKAEDLASDTLLLKGRLWDINFEDYELLRKESEYASWMYIYGFCPNHFTVLVNELEGSPSLAEVNSLLKDKGFKLNDAGGEIKGSPDQLLEQSSTIADRVTVKFESGDRVIPACYYEFAKRYPLKDGKLYQGFIAASADKIFESTDVSLAEKVLSKDK